jgi:uncharacterized protein (TIRG00374 family)
VLVLAVLFLAGLAGAARAVDRLAEGFKGGAASLATGIGARLGEFADGAAMSGRRRVVLGAAFLSVLAWGMDATVIWLAAASLGITLEPGQAIVISGVAVLGTAVPAAPGYIGTYDLAASAAAVAVGIAPESALAIAIVAHALTLLFVAFAGVLALISVQRDALRGASAARDVPGAAVDRDPVSRVRSVV